MRAASARREGKMINVSKRAYVHEIIKDGFVAKEYSCGMNVTELSKMT
ncbi:hypothetical protein M6B38_277405 [Iris pallida]|uniref:Uncharacterized protein n=1 Tax=Iris pallida TaxID=29817 RepID=A0AAX6I397_IRIPA|nr:hypothetical protein M6B38_277405 [Iris pallida]